MNQSSLGTVAFSLGKGLISECALMFMLLCASPSFAQQQSQIKGVLLGHDGRPMPKAHVHLSRFDESKDLVTVEASADGNFNVVADLTGVVVLRLTGVNHKNQRIVLYLEKGDNVSLTARLSAYDYVNSFESVKIIGDFNDFSYDSARAMARRADGTYVAEFQTGAQRFAYQLVGIDKSGNSINGTQADEYVYDGGGDYRSVVTPKNGRVKIVFNPRLLSRSDTAAVVSFADPSSRVARFASIYDAIQKRRSQFQKALRAYAKTGKPLYEFSFDWSADLTSVAAQLREETNPIIRQALLLAYLDIGDTAYGARLDSGLSRMALVEIPPSSTLWSIDAYLIGVALKNQERSEFTDKYVDELAETNPTPFVRTVARTQFSSSRAIMRGKMGPAFSIALLDDPKRAVTTESFRGKVLLIDFWATWCQPCLEEMANLHRAYEKYRDKNFEILSVSLDDNARIVEEYRKGQWKMPWLHSLMQSNKELKKQFEIIGIPKPVLIDKTGKIVAVGLDLRGRNLMPMLDSVLRDQ